MARNVGLLCFIQCFLVVSVSGYSGQDIAGVITYLFTNSSYNYRIRPVANHTTPVTVVVDFFLKSIVEFDEKAESLKTAGFLAAAWRDEYLTWNASEHNGVTSIFLPQNEIWKPDLSLYNAFKTFTGLGSAFLQVKVTNDGSVSWVPFQILQSTCSLDITYFPFDIQECSIKFSAWSYTRSEVDINMGNNGVILDEYEENASWTLQSTTYEEINSDEAAVIFIVRLQRKPSFYMLNVLAPVILLSALNILTFCLPCSSGERASYAITVFLALAVFLSIVASELPKNSDNPSYISIYLTIMTTLSTIIVSVSIFEVRLIARSEKYPMGLAFHCLVKFYRLVRCRSGSCRKNAVVDADLEEKKEPGLNDKNDNEPTNTWQEVVNAIDFFSFWICFLITLMTTLVVFLLISTNKLERSDDQNANYFY
ncbi:Neuronal acetylcholine receptor subunit alpha-5 [Mactra antiquata]